MTRRSNNPALTAILGRRRWRASDAEAVLAAWRSSGESVRAFARRHGMVAERLLRWRRLLAGRTPIRFHPVRMVGDGKGEVSRIATGGVELVLRNGRRVAVQVGYDAELLEEVVRAAESWPC